MAAGKVSEKQSAKRRQSGHFMFLFLVFAYFLLFPAFSWAAADFIVATDDYSRIYVAESNGDGSWGALIPIDYLGGNYSRGVTINDFDNDGDLDFVAGRGISGTGYYYLFLNDGSNNFTKTARVGTQSNAGSYAMDMASGDFNNDGNMDFAANGNQSTTGIWLGDGKGGFSKTELNWGAYGRGMDIADFNHDGNVDIVRGRYSSGYIDVKWGDGTGAFPSETFLGDVGSDPYGVVAGDFDNDGHPDVFANYGSNGDTYFIKGNGDGTFQAPVSETTLDLNNHGGFDAYDYNGDGNLDVLIANYTGRHVYYYPGIGDGTFGAAVDIGSTTTNAMGISALPLPSPAGRPAAEILPSAPSVIVEGGSIDFDGSGSSDSDGTITSWAWVFDGIGTNILENPPAYTFTTEGTYATTLLVTDDDNKSDLAIANVVVQGDTPVIDTTPLNFGELDADYGVWDINLDAVNFASDAETAMTFLWDMSYGFTEDFEDGDASGWQVYAGTWDIEDTGALAGSYSYRQTDTGADRTWVLFDHHFDTDHVIEADVHLAAGSYDQAQILFRAQNQYNNYEFILRGQGYNDVLLYRRLNNITTNLIEYDLINHPAFAGSGTTYVDVGNTYSVKIVLTGPQIDFYLDGEFLFGYSDSTFTGGQVGFSTYRTDAIFDNLVVTTLENSQTVIHRFPAGPNTVHLTATDAAGQSASGTIPITIAAGGVPTAEANGPYTVDEAAAYEGGWTVDLDSTGSTDDVEIQQYVWDLGTDSFNGTQINEGKWTHNGDVTQDGEVSITHPSSGWGQQYFFSKDIYTRAPGMAFETRVKQVSQNAMVGFKNTNNTFHYNQMPYALYFADGNLYIYEDGASRGDTGYDYSYNTWYDIRIELKETQGARYYYRLAGDPDWILLYDSDYGTATEFKRGFDVYHSTFVMDDLREIAAGPTPSYRLYGQATHPVTLTVYDRAGQSDTDTASVTTSGGVSPEAVIIDDALTLGEAASADGIWIGNFDASSSTDDLGIYTYEWDWNYDGTTFVSSGDTGATPSHTWTATGTYTVAVRVTDHALQSHIDTITVVVEMGDPPVAEAGGPYAVDEFSGNAFEGAWSVTLDGSSSSDDDHVDRYFWDLGTETFDGTQLLGGKWYTSVEVTQDDAVSVTGVNSWGNRYIVSRGTVPKEKGQVFQARVKDLGTGDAMLGFKNTITTNFSYTQFPYQFYLYNRNIYIYEHSSNRGDTGYDIAADTWYDFKIELTNTGAVYSYKLATDPTWTVIYTSTYQPADTNLLKGMVVHNSTFVMDDFKETAGGETPVVYVSGLGSNTIGLTVYDGVDQTDSDGSSITTSANAVPVADAGADQNQGEADASIGRWTVNFSGTASDDGPNDIYLVEWDFDYDGSNFNPSGETGLEISHIYDAIGVYTVAMRVTDHGLQSVIDTLDLTITGGAAPTANAGADITTEGELVVRFNGTDSTDDFRIRKYEWDFGDGMKGIGPTPAHIYHTPGPYIATLTVWDEANQTDTDIVTVTVLAAGEAAGPSADAGGPYNAGAGGPPAYLNASASSDDHGIVKYSWDVDDAVDSNSDGNFTNDVDIVGRKPFYTYADAGSYTVTLAVEDGAGQQSTATSTVNVAVNLAPDVICVPWRGSDPTIPHETISGESARLKGIVRDAGDLEYRWNFGDGSGWTAWAAVTNKYAIEADHTYTGADQTPYTAILEVRDSAGLVGQDLYYLEIEADDYDTRTNIAIDNGLWYIHKQQIRPAGYWAYGSYESASTASSLQAFVINSHVQGGDHQEDPYVETVTEGFEDLFSRLTTLNIAGQTAGDPDTNGNGIGIQANSSGSRPIYEGGPVMDAIAASNTPGAFAYTGPSGVTGRYYLDILRDMADAFAWGQVDSGTYRGGWRYGWNSGADNSACQWAAIGMIAAEDNFGIWIPDFVKTENNDYWLQYSYNGTGFGYASAGNTAAGTPSGMVQLAFDGVYTNDPRWSTAEDALAASWIWGGQFYYATYAMVKALRLAQPSPVLTFGSTGLDWYDDPISGLRKYLVDRQELTGAWYYGGHGGGSDRDLSTPWVVIMLTPALFTQPPEADAGDDIIWAFDEVLSFDAAGSRHLDPLRSIVLYEWDFDGDGTYDFTTTNPSDPAATYTYPDPNPGTDGDPSVVYTARLRVTDDNDPVQTDIDTREVEVAEPPHAPFADAGGPYTVTAGISFTLDGNGSFDIDPGDSITRYEWDVDNDGVFFDDVDVDTTNVTTTHTYATTGVYNIALKVYDNGAFNPTGCTIGVDCDSMESLPVFTTVTVVENQPPVADANGPYEVDEGSPVTLDGTGSSDPNGDALSYAWDLDNDGEYDDATGVNPSYSWPDNGTYTVGLKVSDSLLEDTTTATVIVNNVAPAVNAGPDQTVNEGDTVSFSGSFADPGSADTHTIEWDFGDGSSTVSGTLTPTHVYADNGVYTVTLTVTDDDGGVGSDTLLVTVNNVAPVVDAGPDQTVDEGDTVNFSGSFTDPGSLDTHTYTWDFGDGSPAVSGTLTPDHVYAGNGAYTVTLTVTDNDGGVGSDTLLVAVNNVAPTVDVGPDQIVNEGDTVNFSGSFTDSENLDAHTYSWDFGDGSSTVSGTLTPTHVYADNGVYTVTLTVTDDDGGVGSDTLLITVNNVPPTVDAGPDQAVQTGYSVGFTGSFTDPGSADTHTITWDFGDGTASVAGTLTPTHAYDSAGVFTVTLTVTDDDGGVGTDTLIVTVTLSPRGTIIIEKQTNPDGASEIFTFSGAASGSIADGEQIVVGDLNPGTYVVTEAALAGWTLDSIVLEDDNGSFDVDARTVTFRVAEGETVKATFFNNKEIIPGTIIVEKQTDPDGATQSFEFSTSYGSNFSLLDDQASNSGPLAPGIYSVSEINIPSGWNLTNAICDDGSDPNAIELDPGETVTVTFTNTQEIVPGMIIVEKQTDPDGATQSFEFSTSYGSNFSLSDDQASNSGPLPPGIYSVSEINLPAGWSLSSVVASDGSAPGEINLESGETVVVIFTNTQAPQDFCGDLDNDGDVDVSDMMILRGALRKCTGDAGFIEEADYDLDGCITFNDYRAWYSCYQAYLSSLSD